MSTAAGFEGAPPSVTVGPAPVQSETVQHLTETDSTVAAVAQATAPVPMSEEEKYTRMWQHPEYRTVAPGEDSAMLFLEQARPKPGSSVIDFGAGTGRGALMLAITGMKVHMLDFAENCLDEDIRKALTTQAHVLSFTKHDLTRESPVAAEYGYCTDVMEHIPPENVNRVLANILKSAQHVFFQISCTDDVCGALIGQPLHLSVYPYAWWLEKFNEIGCLIHWSQDFGSHCCFYLTAWQPTEDLVDAGQLNTTTETIREQVRMNVSGPWEQVIPHPTNDTEVMILAAGPSLNDFEKEIHQLRADGVKLVTLNGTYHWALARGLTPSATVVVDAREFNNRFTHPVVDQCKYLICSQVHPSVLSGLPHDRTLLWHTSTEDIHDILSERYKTWHSVPGGSTVMLRTIPLLRMLGFRKFHLFGFDSCLRDEVHHAFAQPENDTELVLNTVVCGRTFRCHVEHVAQAREFIDLIKFLGNEIDLEVYGDGMIAHMLRAGAEMADADEAKGIEHVSRESAA